MSYTKSIKVLCDTLEGILDTAKDSIGIQEIYRGLQELVPVTPSIMIGRGRKTRTIATTRQYRIDFAVDLVIFHGKLKSTELIQVEMEQLVEDVEDVLNADMTLGGLITHGWVSRTDSGTAAANGVLFRSTRIIYTAQAREVF